MSSSIHPMATRRLDRPGLAVLPVSFAPHALILAVMWFNFLLCFANTRHWLNASGAVVALTQIVLLAAAAYLGRRLFSSTQAAFALFVVGTVIALKISNPAIDLKILFDLAIAPAFLVLGLRCTVFQGSRILRNVLICIVLVGFVEMAFTTWYESVINIWSYFVSKGTVAENTTNFTGTSFFVSGERSEQAGRTLLGGLLGPHRASSLFLEPVSMGNLPIICLAWLLCVRLSNVRLAAFLFVLTGACVVLPDSRFASVSCALMGLLRLTGLHRSALFAALLPILVMMALWVVGSVAIAPAEVPHILSDDLGGRLLFSGKLLAYWTPANWFGFEPSPIYVSDTGYAYLVSNVGLPLALALWAVFAFAPVRTEEAAGMRGMISLYYATSLAINASAFSIKTAALLWFLYGTTLVASPSRTVDLTRTSLRQRVRLAT